MASTSQAPSQGGLGFAGALAIVFIVLKLSGVIDWSWWWVLSPIWIGWALVALILMVALVLALAGKRPR